MKPTLHQRENRQETTGYVETVEEGADGAVVLLDRLDKGGIDPFENEVQLDGPLFVSDEIEADLFDASDPRGGSHE